MGCLLGGGVGEGYNIIQESLTERNRVEFMDGVLPPSR